jgi:hypothetical protein
MPNTGGKVLLYQPAMFADGIVSIGDIQTLAVSGTSSTVVGASSQASDGSQMVVLGGLASATTGATLATVVGFQAIARQGAPLSFTAGFNNVTEQGGTSNTNIGVNNVLRGSSRALVLGIFSTTFNNVTQSAFIGSGSIPVQNSSSIGIGEITTSQAGSAYLLIGQINLPGAGGVDLTAIGISVSLSAVGSGNVAIGSGTQIDGVQNQYCIGSASHVGALASDSILIGASATCTAYGTLALGSQASAASQLSIAIGTQAVVLASSNSSIALGHSAYVDRSQYGIAIGLSSKLTLADNAIAIGPGQIITAGSAIAIGVGVTVASPYAIAIGTISIDNISNRSIALGNYGAITNSPYSILVTPSNILTSAGVTDSPGYSTALGYATDLTLAPYSLIVGQQMAVIDTTIADSTPNGAHIGVGSTIRFNDGTSGTTCVSVNCLITHSDHATIVGGSSIAEAPRAVILGYDIATSVSASHTVAIGAGARVSAPHTIALGAFAATTVANSMEVGSSLPVGLDPAGTAAIHTMRVKGYNITAGTGLDTVYATDNPLVAGETGLSIVCNVAAALSNKTIKAAAAPTVGSMYLYINP